MEEGEVKTEILEDGMEVNKETETEEGENKYDLYVFTLKGIWIIDHSILDLFMKYKADSDEGGMCMHVLLHAFSNPTVLLPICDDMSALMRSRPRNVEDVTDGFLPESEADVIANEGINFSSLTLTFVSRLGLFMPSPIL